MMNKFKNFILKYRVHLISLLIIFFYFTTKAYLNHIFFLDFADEEDNFLLGKYLLSGKKLYSDYFSHHQPVSYILSALIQLLSHPKNIFLVVKRHREFMIFWGFIWSVILTIRFGSPLFISIIILELSKILLLGNLFLTESFIIYPLMYVVSYVLTQNKKTILMELIFVGLLLGFIFFSLSPAWPILAFMYIILIFNSKYKFRTFLMLLITFAMMLLIVFLFSSPKDYLYNTIFINYKYYLTLTKDFSGQFSIIKSFFAPIIALFYPKNLSLILILKSVSLVLIINLFFLIKNKKYKTVFVIFLLLGLALIRYVEPHRELYSGFHMLPWFTVLIVATLLTTFNLIKKYYKYKYFFGFLLLFIITVAAYQSKSVLFDKRDTVTDYYIHYSPHDDYSTAIKIMGKDNDTLFVVTIKNFYYWYSNVKPASKYTYFYEWMEKVPPIANEVETLFETNPPTFLWCDCQKQKSIILQFINKYTALKRDGKPTILYVRKDKAAEITEEMKKKLNFYRFGFE